MDVSLNRCKCGTQFCYKCTKIWKTCACPQFDERGSLPHLQNPRAHLRTRLEGEIAVLREVVARSEQNQQHPDTQVVIDLGLAEDELSLLVDEERRNRGVPEEAEEGARDTQQAPPRVRLRIFGTRRS